MTTINILGISAFYHDSAAALIVNGDIVAAVQEERFTREKADNSFPIQATRYCLLEAGLSLDDIDYVVFYDDVEEKMSRIIHTQRMHAPFGIRQFSEVIPVWMKRKIKIESLIADRLRTISPSPLRSLPILLSSHHHRSHAAAAFFPSPFEHAAVLCIDGVGEWATTSGWLGEGGSLTPLWEIHFPHSLGLMYSTFTYYAGFKVNFGEYKLMGLAPYGQPKFKDLILKHIIDVHDDGTFRLNMKYFDFQAGQEMINEKFEQLFGCPKRKPESDVTQHDMDIASSIQTVINEIILKLATTLRRETGIENLCLGGGVALNCVANGELARQQIYKSIWVQPACGDAGSSLGAALSVWYEYLKQPRQPQQKDSMSGALLGPEYDLDEIKSCLVEQGAAFTQLDESDLVEQVASLLAEGNVVGWFQGRMEFGPRALGNRSILGDPRCQKMQKKMNLKIKFRESFRPFAPAILCDYVGDYFESVSESKYMLFVMPVLHDQRKSLSAQEKNYEGLKKLSVERSSIPAVTHVDYSARVQTVHPEINPLFYNLIDCFRKKTGCPLLINTSFNIRGEPIVCTPMDAFRCFMRTNMDYLVVGNFILDKKQQPSSKVMEFKNIFQELD